MTRSPGRTDVTPGPTFATSPAISWPRVRGATPRLSTPLRKWSSVWQTPAALTRTSASPGPGCGMGTSSRRRLSPGPW